MTLVEALADTRTEKQVKTLMEKKVNVKAKKLVDALGDTQTDKWTKTLSKHSLMQTERHHVILSLTR